MSSPLLSLDSESPQFVLSSRGKSQRKNQPFESPLRNDQGISLIKEAGSFEEKSNDSITFRYSATP